ncbi:amidase family protein [Mycobacterium xenopi 3993]|nr:amidase family protein [Mycobacterium xenopi 3993]
MSGQPAINVPVEWTDGGLPVGVQLVAAYGREDVLLQVASQLEAAKPWRTELPIYDRCVNPGTASITSAFPPVLGIQIA